MAKINILFLSYISKVQPPEPDVSCFSEPCKSIGDNENLESLKLGKLYCIVFYILLLFLPINSNSTARTLNFEFKFITLNVIGK